VKSEYFIQVKILTSYVLIYVYQNIHVFIDMYACIHYILKRMYCYISSYNCMHIEYEGDDISLQVLLQTFVC